jgi:DNA-binding transcriptional regulator YdaS (Cro superfamily)
MTLRDYIPRGKREAFAGQLGVSVGFLAQLCSGLAKPSAVLCVDIERVTLGKVTRVELRPDLFGDL